MTCGFHSLLLMAYYEHNMIVLYIEVEVNSDTIVLEVEANSKISCSSK